MASEDERKAAAVVFPGPIHGLRTWRTDRDGSLAGLARGVVWPSGKPLRARCLHRDHAPPASGCECGFYGFHPSAERLEWLAEQCADHVRNVVLGVFEAWGRVEVHGTGFRAEIARPRALISFRDDRRRRHTRTVRAARAHGVEILRVGDCSELWELIRGRGWTGLDPHHAEELVIETTEVGLLPAADIAGEPGEEAFGGTGFWLMGEEEHEKHRHGTLRRSTPGVISLTVRGTRHFAPALADHRFDRGRPLRLVPELSNLHDPNAVGIWDEHRAIQVGYVPRHLAPEVADWVGSRKVHDARVLWQWRRLSTGERYSLQVLISRCPVRLATPAEREAEAEAPF